MFYWRWLSDLLHGPKTTTFPAQSDPHIVSRGEIHIQGTLNDETAPIRRAMAIRHVDGGSCNGCESELQLLTSPDYDFLGLVFLHAVSASCGHFGCDRCDYTPDG